MDIAKTVKEQEKQMSDQIGAILQKNWRKSKKRLAKL